MQGACGSTSSGVKGRAQSREKLYEGQERRRAGKQDAFLESEGLWKEWEQGFLANSEHGDYF